MQTGAKKLPNRGEGPSTAKCSTGSHMHVARGPNGTQKQVARCSTDSHMQVAKCSTESHMHVARGSNGAHLALKSVKFWTAHDFDKILKNTCTVLYGNVKYATQRDNCVPLFAQTER